MAVASKNGNNTRKDFVTEHYPQHGKEIQKYGDVVKHLPHPLDADIRSQMCKKLNQLLADSIALRDLYKKHHWQTAGHTFYQLHLLFDAHYETQAALVDKIAERIQMLGGVSLALAPDIAEETRVPRAPRGREEVPVQLSRLLEAHEIILAEAHTTASAAAGRGDDGTNDLMVSDVIRANQMQVWFLAEHLVDESAVHAGAASD